MCMLPIISHWLSTPQDDLLLLRKGGQVVYHGELGEKDCSTLVSYFESKGAKSIALGDNPANWMLRVLDSSTVGDLADQYVEAVEYADLKKELEDIHSNQEPEMKVEFTEEFAAPGRTRRFAINRRLRIIYWRSPTYNYARLLVSVVIAFVLGSVFVADRHPAVFTETGMRARVSVIFLTFIITGIMAILSVLPVMTKIRDMFYRHRDAGMYDSLSMGLALGVAEQWFIVVSTVLFTTVFLATAGLMPSGASSLALFGRSIAFWVSRPCSWLLLVEGRDLTLMAAALSGLLHLQLLNLLILRPALCRSGKADGNGSDLV